MELIGIEYILIINNRRYNISKEEFYSCIIDYNRKYAFDSNYYTVHLFKKFIESRFLIALSTLFGKTLIVVQNSIDILAKFNKFIY